jgi:hypothetical protein
MTFDGGDFAASDSPRFYHKANAFSGLGRGRCESVAKCCFFVSSQLGDHTPDLQELKPIRSAI